MAVDKYIPLDSNTQNAAYVFLENRLMIRRLFEELLALINFQQGIIDIGSCYSMRDEYELHAMIIKYMDLCISSIEVLQKSDYLERKISFPIEHVLLRLYRNYHQHAGITHFKPCTFAEQGTENETRFYIYSTLSQIPKIKEQFPDWSAKLNRVEVSELLERNQSFINGLISRAEDAMHTKGISVKMLGDYNIGHYMFGNGAKVSNDESWDLV